MEWISVEDKLPNESERVLSISKFENEIKVDYFIYLPEIIWVCRLEDEIVTHWMPLPKPPEE